MDKILPKKKQPLMQKLSAVLSTALGIKPKEDDPLSEKRALLSEIEKALSDLRIARNCFEDARDPEMIEACVYEIKSAEARYSFLLRKAKLLANYKSLRHEETAS